MDKVLLESHVQDMYDVSEYYHNSQFRGSRLKRVVEFLNSVLHPVRPERITAKLATSYVQAFYGLASSDWGVILVDCLRPLTARIQTRGGKKACLTPYLLHMYERFGLLDPAKITHWREVKAPQELAPRAAPPPPQVIPPAPWQTPPVPRMAPPPSQPVASGHRKSACVP
jgi:hypothetical protein